MVVMEFNLIKDYTYLVIMQLDLVITKIIP